MGYTEIMSYEEACDTEALKKKCKKGMTQADIMAVVGLGKRSPNDIWMNKVGKEPLLRHREGLPWEKSVWLAKFEKLVAEEFGKRENKILKPYGVLQSDEDPLMLSACCYFVEGENAGVTPIMTKWIVDKDVEGNEENLKIYMNCQWNMAVTGCDKWYVPILYNNENFFFKVVERNVGDIEMLKKKAEEFWRLNVKLVRPPDADDSVACAVALKAAYKGGIKRRETIDDGETKVLVDDIMLLKEQMRTLKKILLGKENKLKMKLGNIEKADVGKYVVLWEPKKKWLLNYDKVRERDYKVYYDCLESEDIRPLEIKIRR